jgi:hypothetical protein
MNLQDVLLNKARRGELAHFYVIEAAAPEEEAHAVLVLFAHQFIRDYYQKVEGHRQSLANLMDHPDVYVIGNAGGPQEEKSDKAFKVEEAEGLSRFFEFRPVQGKRKFAVITEGHRVNTLIANKWLKLLEEPQGESTIFLLNPRRVQLIPTIHSRALHLRLPSAQRATDLTEWDSFLHDVKKLSLSQFLETYSRSDVPLSHRVNELIIWESEQTDGFAQKDALQRWLRSFDEMETFHQPTATKWALFYSYLKEFVLPRRP